MAIMIKESTWWDVFWSMLCGVWLRRNDWVSHLKKISIEDLVRKASEASSTSGEQTKENLGEASSWGFQN